MRGQCYIRSVSKHRHLHRAWTFDVRIRWSNRQWRRPTFIGAIGQLILNSTAAHGLKPQGVPHIAPDPSVLVVEQGFCACVCVTRGVARSARLPLVPLWLGLHGRTDSDMHEVQSTYRGSAKDVVANAST
jgi:hypothetical protein